VSILDGISKAAKQAQAKAAAAAPGAPPDGDDFFAGMDVAGYPGDEAMLSLIQNTNLVWTGFYLTPAPSQGHNLKWMGKHQFLRDLGWGIAPIYVGRQVKFVPNADHRITPENGTKDGGHAAQLAREARLTPQSVIYLDFENGAPLMPEQKTYYANWAAALRKAGFLPGVYCVASIAAGLASVVPEAEVWVANYSKFPKQVYTDPFPHPDPSVGAPDASMWQLRGNTTIEYFDAGGRKQHLVVDLNSSLTQDPSGVT
jgi:hypothetical protein